MSNIRHVKIPIDSIILLEENPREITDDELKKLSEDIEKDPNFLHQRPSLINLVNNEHRCYAGTQRIKAQKLLGYKKAICFVEENVSPELQKERMLKDNLHRGKWDVEKLMDLDFDMIELEDIGFQDFDLFNSENIGKSELVDVVNDENEEWVDMPEFNVPEKSPKIMIHFEKIGDRKDFIEQHKIKVSKKLQNIWIVKV